MEGTECYTNARLFDWFSGNDTHMITKVLINKQLCVFEVQKILFFLLPVWARGIRPSPVGKLDPKTMGVAVGIALISSVQAEIHVFEVDRLPSWIFSLPVWSHCSLVSPIGKLDPENIGIAVEISLISCM